MCVCGGGDGGVWSEQDIRETNNGSAEQMENSHYAEAAEKKVVPSSTKSPPSSLGAYVQNPSSSSDPSACQASLLILYEI